MVEKPQDYGLGDVNLTMAGGTIQACAAVQPSVSFVDNHALEIGVHDEL